MNNQYSNIQNEQNQLPPTSNYRPSTSKRLTDITKAGLILQIIVSVVGSLLSLILVITAVTTINDTVSPGNIFDSGTVIIMAIIIASVFIVTLILSCVALAKKTHGIVLAAGIFGLLFTGLVAGIFTLVGNHD